MNSLLTKNNFFVAAYATALLVGVLCISTSVSYAQFLRAGTGVRIFLSLSPEHPQPGESVRITADSSLIDLSRSEIEWYADDKIITESPGQKETGLTAGPLGSETHVSIVARALDGTVASGEVFIRPAEVGLLWESDSYVPPFYRGRALPSAGTFIRASAVVRFAPVDAPQIPEQDIIYTWRRNGSVMSASSGRGRSSAIFPSPTLFGADTIQVNAETLDGKYEGEARTIIPSIEPVLVLYKDHPLFGVMYNDALEEASSIPDAEMAFNAVPYFSESDNPNDPRLNYSWSVNGNEIPSDESKRSELTINADKSNGLAQIALSVTHASNFLMQSSRKWLVSFGSETKAL